MHKDIIKQIIERLPSQDRILTEGNKKQNSVLIPIILKDDQIYVLFEKRSKYVSQPGEICFPGGRFEISDKNLEETAIRETSEELGVPIDEIMVLGKLGVMDHYRSLIHCYVGFINWSDAFKDQHNLDEVENVFMIPFEELLCLKAESYKIKLKAYSYEHDEDGNETELFPAETMGIPSSYFGEWDMGYRYIVVYRWKEEVIWGITGKFVQYLREMLSEK